MAKAIKLAAEMVSADAGLHADQARRQVGKAGLDLATRPFLAQYDGTLLIVAYNVERVLADIDANHGDCSVEGLGVPVVFMPTPADAAKTSSADKAAIKEATLACKADAKEKRIRWPASQKFVSNCAAMHVKLSPEELQKVAVKQAIVACKAQAKGKKIRWPWSRKFVSGCLSNALKDYALDVNLLRRERGIAGLRSYTAIETGCLQNVYCEEP